MTHDHGRRSFLKHTLSTLGAAAAATLLPESIQKALAIPAASPTRSIRDVQHVVILMQENRSFDHYLGSLSGIRGFNDRSTLPIDGQASIWHQPDGNGGFIAPFRLDSKRTCAQTINSLPHDWASGHAAWNDGRWDRWVPAKTAITMGHFTRQDLPFHYALADAFTVCDAYFSSCMGPTNTNRLHLMTGMLDVQGSGGGPLILNEPSHRFGWTTYAERLQNAGVSWRVYQGSDGSEPFRTAPVANPPGSENVDYPSPYNVLRFFEAFHPPRLTPGLRDNGLAKHTLAQFAHDVRHGSLPQVSWLLPPYLCSEHPSRAPADGATYIAAVLDALTAVPETWSKTALFIMYDENDGFFDHVVPPCPPIHAADGRSNVDTADEYYAGSAESPAGPVGLGARVPMFVVSPWSKGAWTCSQVFDHTSVIRFLETRFGVREPNVSAWRRAVCGDLTSAFDFVHPDAGPVRVPSVAGLSAAAARESRLPWPQAPAKPTPAVQERGVRRARPLPYALVVSLRRQHPDGALALDFANTGSQAAALQVHARQGGSVVKRYTVAAGTRLDGEALFAHPAVPGTPYELTAIGPNGFLRRFAGAGAASDRQEAMLTAAGTHEPLRFVLHNDATAPCTFVLHDNRYGQPDIYATVGAGQQRVLPWQLLASHHWYDVSIRCDADAAFLRQFAGHLETGAPSLTDPALA